MNPTDKLLAYAQIIIAAIFSIGVFAVVFILLFFSEHLTSTATTILTSVITALVTILTLQMNFFFARQRQAGLPDATNTVTQTHTAADGSITKIVSPVSAPAQSVPSLPITASSTVSSTVSTTAAPAAPLATSQPEKPQ